MKGILSCEQEYIDRVENIDKKDLEDICLVNQAAVDFFRQHWVLFVLDSLLWDIFREKPGKWEDAMEHLHRRIRFHKSYYNRPTLREAVISSFRPRLMLTPKPKLPSDPPRSAVQALLLVPTSLAPSAPFRSAHASSSSCPASPLLRT